MIAHKPTSQRPNEWPDGLPADEADLTLQALQDAAQNLKSLAEVLVQIPGGLTPESCRRILTAVGVIKAEIDGEEGGGK